MNDLAGETIVREIIETCQVPAAPTDNIIDLDEQWREQLINRFAAAYEILKAERDRLREALGKYADRKNYDGSPSSIDFDDGEAARTALGIS